MIGGFACDLLMNDAGLDFRQTVDIDMVLTVEALTTDFAKAFWLFIEAGGYQARQRSNGKQEFYRFIDPTNPAYPKIIELFSRPQSNVVLQPGTHPMPLHIEDNPFVDTKSTFNAFKYYNSPTILNSSASTNIFFKSSKYVFHSSDSEKELA